MRHWISTLLACAAFSARTVSWSVGQGAGTNDDILTRSFFLVSFQLNKFSELTYCVTTQLPEDRPRAGLQQPELRLPKGVVLCYS